jgi:hypothetical protein
MRKYGRYGNPEHTGDCVVEVWQDFWSYQCSRKRGHGPDGLYCKQHAKMVEEGRHVSVPDPEGRL